MNLINKIKFTLSPKNSALYISIFKYIQHKKDVDKVLKLPTTVLKSAASWLEQSKAQLHQDIFVLAEHDFKSAGYFVEFGATNGHDLSNTYLLETQFGWQGIVAEPAKSWHEALKKNRQCHIETDCVWRKKERYCSSMKSMRRNCQRWVRSTTATTSAKNEATAPCIL